MTRAGTIIALTCAVVLSACSGPSASLRNLNPANWLAPTAPEPKDPVAEAQDRANSALERIAARQVARDVAKGLVKLDDVIEMRLDFTPRGAILRARARASEPGHHSAQLVALNDGQIGEDGQLYYAIMARPTGGASLSPVISAATFISSKRLIGLRGISIDALRGVRRIALR